MLKSIALLNEWCIINLLTKANNLIKGNIMKQRHLISLMVENYNTIRVRFLDTGVNEQPVNLEPVEVTETKERMPWNDGIEDSSKGRTWVYKVPKNLTLAKGSYVLVLAPRNILKVAEVVEVHNTPQIDFDADFDYQWIVSVVNFDFYKSIMLQEQEFKGKAHEIEKSHQRRAMREKYRESLQDDEMFNSLEALASSTSGANIVPAGSPTASVDYTGMPSISAQFNNQGYVNK